MPTNKSSQPLIQSNKRMRDRVSVEEYYYATLNGDVLSYAWFSWIPRGQMIGWKTLDEVKAYIKEVIPYVPKNFKEPLKWGAKKVWYVCVDGEPAGSMYDFGTGPAITGKRSTKHRKLMIPFPRRMNPQHGGLKTKEIADATMKEFLRYIDDVCSVPPEYRAGSSKMW